MLFLREISQLWSMTFLLEEAGVCHAEPNNDIFNFENGYVVPPLGHQGFSFQDESVYLFFLSFFLHLLAQEDGNSLTE